MTTFSGRPVSRGQGMNIRGFREPLPQWQVFARARFALIPDYCDRAFVWGDNVRSAACSLDGEGRLDFERPLHSPMLRAYTGESCNPVLLLEVRRYQVSFKVIEWKFADSQVEEFVFECRAPA